MSTNVVTQIGRLHELLREAATIETLRKLLREIELIERSGQGTAEIDGIREQVFEGLIRLSTDRPGEACSILQDDLLPLCLREKDEWPNMNMRGRYDEILRKWLDEFPESARENLRASVIAVVVEAMKGARVKPACATAWAFGHRSHDLEEALESIASAHDDEVGDLALRTRVHLGVPETDRANVLADLHRRAERRWNHSLVAALQELADRGSLDVVFNRLEGERISAEGEQKEPFVDDVAVQIPSAIAEQYPQDDLLQDGIWRRLMSPRLTELVQSALIMNGNLAARVDSPEVVPTYLRLIVAGSAARRDVFYYRLEDLVRPRQLLGWTHDPDDRALSLLRDDALEGTAMEANWATQELRRKLLAWETLLSLGRTDLTQLIGPAVDAETNGYVTGEIFDIASCMAVDPLPPCVPELIAGVFAYIADKDDQRLIAHIGAIGLAHSARSEEAFRALLKFEKIKEGGVLLSLIEALADCAAAMINSGKPDAEAILLHSTEGHQPAHRRVASAAALANLMRRRLLRDPCERQILELIHDESLDIYPRRELLDACGYIDPDPLLFAILRTIADGAQVVESPPAGTYLLPELGHIALGALARLGVLASDGDLLVTSLGLAPCGEGWTVLRGDSVPSYFSFVIGLLYASDTRKFAPAVSILIRECDWLALSRLAPYLSLSQDPTPTAVIDALVERIHRVQTSRTSEPELFPLLARLCPHRLLEEDWGDPAGWMSQARAEFAVAVAAARPAARVLQSHLLPLLGDGQYGVRRSAYRAMASVDAEALAIICESWALTKEGTDAAELRQRAAEAAAWLPGQLRTVDVVALATDPEPSVRKAFDRCDQERREREWASLYVRRIVAVEDERDIPLVWRYGRALGKVGDDHALEQLERRRRSPELAPAIRHWLTRVIKKVRVRWDEVTRRWPEPWFARRGRLEEVAGVVVHEGGPEIPFRGWLWHVIENGPIGASSWGGWAIQEGLSTGRATLRIPGRSPAKILVSRVEMPGRTTYFSGNDIYPASS